MWTVYPFPYLPIPTSCYADSLDIVCQLTQCYVINYLQSAVISNIIVNCVNCWCCRPIACLAAEYYCYYQTCVFVTCPCRCQPLYFYFFCLSCCVVICAASLMSCWLLAARCRVLSSLYCILSIVQWQISLIIIAWGLWNQNSVPRLVTLHERQEHHTQYHVRRPISLFHSQAPTAPCVCRDNLRETFAPSYFRSATLDSYRK